VLIGISPAQAQRVQVGPDGVRVDSGRDRDRDRGRRCVTEYTTRVTPSGRKIREKKTVCRGGGRGD
jgi:hypothetical protein